MSEPIRRSPVGWEWQAGLGALLVVLGLMCFWKVWSGSIDNQIIIGVFMLIGGIAEGIHAVFSRAWKGFASDLAPALIYVLSGGIIIGSPITGYFLLTLVVAAALITGAIYRVATLWMSRQMRGWHLLVVAIAVTLLVWLVMLWSWPTPGLFVLGTIAGVGLLVTGFSWFRRGWTLRRWESRHG